MPAISLKNVSKCYLVYESPMKALTRMLAPKMVVPQEVWALRDITLEVEPGECVGIIGNNGSGKSTILAVIGGIISPTTGSVRVNGQLSTLLDLTVGMQKELNGRQNVSILGGLLGLSNEQIKERETMMVDFAELGEAIDRPVKTYSTGMAMRLGFSVALHVDFEVLIVDEVLAVGDSNFHRKCINRMRELNEVQNKTIIIASHGLGEIAALTHRLVLLEKGRILEEGPTEKVLTAYWQACERERNKVGHRVTPLKPVNPYGDDMGDVKIETVRFLDGEGFEQVTFQTCGPMTVEIWFNAFKKVKNPLFRIQIFRNDGTWVHGINTYRHDCDLGEFQGRGCIRMHYGQVNLLEADYYVSVGVWPDEYTSFISDVAYDVREMAFVFNVTSDRSHGAGIVQQPGEWQFLPPGSPPLLPPMNEMINQGSLQPLPAEATSFFIPAKPQPPQQKPDAEEPSSQEDDKEPAEEPAEAQPEE